MIPKISIIVLNYNGLTFLKQCIPTLQKQTYKNIEILVVDNSSTDGSIKYLKSLTNIKIVRNSNNFGYAKANNIAARVAKGTFLFFLNNDTKLFPDTIAKLISCFREKTIVAACQIIPKERGNSMAAGCGIDIFGYPYMPDDRKKARIFFADGATFFIKKTDFMDIGMFDEELFIFQEDIDLCWRAQMFGYTIIPCWKAKVIHYSGGTITGGSEKNNIYTSSYFRRYLNEKNVLRNISKNYSMPLVFLILSLLIFIHLVEISILSLMGKFKVVKCYIEAYSWNVAHFKNTLQVRKKIQKKRVISDFILLKKMYWSYSKFKAFQRVGFPKFA